MYSPLKDETSLQAHSRRTHPTIRCERGNSVDPDTDAELGDESYRKGDAETVAAH